MLNNESDLLASVFQQTHVGKMSLITLMENLPSKELPNMPDIIYDENGRYLKLKEDNSIRNTFIQKSLKKIECDDKSVNRIIEQRIIEG